MQTGFGAAVLQLVLGHVGQRVRPGDPARVGRGVDDVQHLAQRLVEHLLRPDGVVDQAAGDAAAEEREVRHHREVLERRPVVVQHHTLSADHPAHAAHPALLANRAGSLHGGHPGRAQAVDHPDVAGRGDQHLGLLHAPELTIDHPHAALAVGLRGHTHAVVVAAVVVAELVAGLVAHVLAEVAFVRLGLVHLVALGGAVQHLDLVEG
ncbi:hypothetical protein D3C78_1350770 [compost metagenome]